MGMHHGICGKLRQIMDVLFKEFSGLGFIGRERVMGRKPKPHSQGAKKKILWEYIGKTKSKL